THMVSAAALCEAAARQGLAAHLRRNAGAVELPRNAKTLADAIEAIIGAAYLDGGSAAAKQVFDALELTANAEEAEWSGNPKGELQVRAQAMKPPRHPEYELLKTEGKAHEPVFTVRVAVDGMGSATASARSHKQAESLAAAKLLAAL
ncbi:MAG: ribonuclease III, partial [bacterium]|nr:ribonuclease III [Candidatus Colisoma equi]